MSADTMSLTIDVSQNPSVIRVAADGRMFWHEREVTTDEDFRDAMLDLSRCLQGHAR